MDKQKEYLDKVVNQIVSETRIDYNTGRIDSPFNIFYHSDIKISKYADSDFSTHCEEVYGLNYHEVEYVWVMYRKIINDKISNHKYGY